MVTQFSEICRLEQIHFLLNSFYEMTGIRAAVVDTCEQIILEAGWLEACKKFNRSGSSMCARCREIMGVIKTEHAGLEGEGHCYRCKSGNWNLAMPIVVAGKFLGVFLAGRFFSPTSHAADMEEGVECPGTEETEPVRSDENLVRLAVLFENFLKGQAGSHIKTKESGEEAGRESSETRHIQYRDTDIARQIAGGVAYEFNNILQSIVGYTELLAMKQDGDERVREYAEKVLFSANRGSELTERLLAFSGLGLSGHVPVDLVTLLSEFENKASKTLGGDVCFIVDTEEMGLSVMAEKQQCQQMFLNLMSYAVDSKPKSGFLTIKLKPVTVDDNFIRERGFGEVGEYVCVSVIRSGVEMEEVGGTKLYDPGLSANEAGTGLAIVYGIVMQLDGFMAVSTLNDGESFVSIYLPRVSMRNCSTEDKSDHVKLPFRGCETILLADDDKAVRELNCMILRDAGYRVIEAVDGLDAVEKFRAMRDAIDLLVLDVLMPRLNGKIVFEEIGKLRPDIRTLFISGCTKDMLFDKGLPGGNVAFLSKPANPFEFLKKVREVLDLPILAETCRECMRPEC